MINFLYTNCEYFVIGFIFVSLASYSICKLISKEIDYSNKTYLVFDIIKLSSMVLSIPFMFMDTIKENSTYLLIFSFVALIVVITVLVLEGMLYGMYSLEKVEDEIFAKYGVMDK